MKPEHEALIPRLRELEKRIDDNYDELEAIKKEIKETPNPDDYLDGVIEPKVEE